MPVGGSVLQYNRSFMLAFWVKNHVDWGLVVGSPQSTYVFRRSQGIQKIDQLILLCRAQITIVVDDPGGFTRVS